MIADDQHLVRAGFASLLGRARDIAVVGEAATGDEAVLVCRPASAPTSYSWTSACPAGTASRHREIVADPALAGRRVVVLTTFETDEYVFGALRAGASGF